MAIDMYYPDLFTERWRGLSMSEVEKFYSTTLRLEKDKIVISLTAPLLVCMALHGQTWEIDMLLEKFPLISEEGWSFGLEEERLNEKVTIGYAVVKQGEKELGITRRMTIESVYELLESDPMEFIEAEIKEKEELEKKTNG